MPPDDITANAKKVKFWIGFAAFLLGGLFTAAGIAGGVASAADVHQLDRRLTIVETHHDDDDKRLDWIVKALWEAHLATEPPPPRRARMP